ncbi:MAG: Ger(x)C family spore germination protein [Anaerobacillus sp.]
MVKWIKRMLIVLPIITLLGCRSDQLSLEQATISLVLGIDKGKEEGEVEVFETNPVFSMEAKEQVSTLSTTAHSLVEARGNLDSQSSGTVVGGKLQVVLIGKELIAEESIFPFMDVLYRNPKNTPNARIAIVNGPVSDIIEARPADKPRVAVYLSDLIDTTHLRENTVKTTLNEWHHAHFEKGMTPSFTEVERKDEAIAVTGTALFNREDTYEYSLDYVDSALLLMMKEDIEEPVPISFMVDDSPLQMISFRVERVNHHLEVTNKDDGLHFKADLNMTINLTENNSTYDPETELPKITSLIQKQMQHKFQTLIENMQEHQVDPMGYGVYVRAYEYEKWKSVADEWPKAFSDAHIQVNTKIKVLGYGVVD